MWPQIGAVLLPSLLILWQGDQSGQTAPTAEEIGRAVEALAEESFEVRERASEFLWRAGPAAEPALQKALTSSDAEVAARAASILLQFRYGIYCDTPGEVVTLIGRYRYGTQAARLAVLKSLLDKGETNTLLTLLKTEPDEQSRKQLTDGLLKDLDKLAGSLFIKGDWDKAERLLEIGATSDEGMRNYAAYLLLRRQQAARISELQARIASVPPADWVPGFVGAWPVDAKLLAYLLRSTGDLRGAHSAAEHASDPLLRAGILFELGDWRRLAELHRGSPQKTTATLAGGIVDLGYAAAYNRLAGNASEFEKSVVGIKKLAERKPNKLWYCGETLIINERYEDAVELLKEGRRTAAFEILCLQLRFGDAVRLAGVADVRGPYSPWLVQPEPGTRSTSVQRRDRFAMGLCLASMLFRLNQKEQAARLFSELGRAAAEDNNLSLRSVCEAEYEAGLRDQAFEHAAAVLSRGWNTSLLGTLFPEHRDTAGIWWRFFCQKHLQEPRNITIGRLRRFLQPTPPLDTAGADWMSLAAEAQAVLQRLNSSEQGKWLTAIAQTYLARGEPRSAQSCLRSAAHLAPSVSTFIQLGDLAAEDTQWERAAQWYLLAWEKDRTKPTPLFLRGRALVQAGDVPEGRRVIEAARILPLGNAKTRCDFAEDLHGRGLTDEARRQWEWTVRTGQFQSAPVNQAAERLGDLAAGEDDLKAAAYWQWPLMRCLRTSTSNLGIAGYLRRAHLIHKARARGLIAAGKIDEAVDEIRLSHAALPGEVELVLELGPLLEQSGRRQEADRLFAKVFAVHETVCNDFPRSAAHRHHLARLAAGSGRRLDEAMQHANRAVALDPNNAAYLSTLAELHFQRGDREQAIELAQRCAELAPEQKQFFEQLRRFKTP